ncbi:hypothetical protein MTY414_23350 [Mycolicibacterium mageritense]|nr:hypothetical protein MTY414_23350 [Mycolicibacterium mageritense]
MVDHRTVPAAALDQEDAGIVRGHGNSDNDVHVLKPLDCRLVNATLSSTQRWMSPRELTLTTVFENGRLTHYRTLRVSAARDGPPMLLCGNQFRRGRPSTV